MPFFMILIPHIVLSNLNTDSPPNPFPSLLDSVLLWQENIEMHLQEKTNQADVVCCLQHLQVLYFSSLLSLSLSLSLMVLYFPSEYQIPNLKKHLYLQLCFETEERARKLLQNVSSLLKPGAYFFGITPDSSTIWYEMMIAVDLLFLELFVNFIGI
jgi:hypothetical protein